MPKLTPISFCLAILLLTAAAHAGYTHYWTWLKTPDESALTSCVADMQQILNACKPRIVIYPPTQTPDPIDPKTKFTVRIGFNGIDDDEYEPFYFPGRTGFNFCKTEWKNYDDVVLTCLLVARDHFGPDVLEISSDGSWESGAWKQGAALYEATFHRPARNPMPPAIELGPRGNDDLPDLGIPHSPMDTWSPERKAIAITAAIIAMAAGIALLRKRR